MPWVICSSMAVAGTYGNTTPARWPSPREIQPTLGPQCSKGGTSTPNLSQPDGRSACSAPSMARRRLRAGSTPSISGTTASDRAWRRGPALQGPRRCRY